MGMFTIVFDNGSQLLCYSKGDDHQPPAHTVMNFPVDDIDAEAKKLMDRGISFLRYDCFEHDELGVARNTGGEGPHMAWFADPAGNTLALMQLKK
jgi:predicted enzyme related to lactoylglutathione lyase